MSKTRIIAIVIRHLYIWPRTLERLMGSFGWPLVGLVTWGLTMSFLQKNLLPSFSLVAFILGGVIFWEIVSIPQREISVNFLDEAWNQNLINVFSTPITNREYLLALVILGLIKLFISLFSLIVGGLILYKFNLLTSFGLYIPFLLINLLFFGLLFGFLINGFILRFGYSVAEFAWALLALISPFSCVFYPVSSLPFWAQKIALLMPTTYVFEEMRRILFTGGVNWNNLFISFSLNIFYLILSLLFFNWMFENAREHGRLVKLN